MPTRTGTAHVVTTKREYKGKTYRSHLLRRSYREDGKVKNETLGNLSHLPEPLIDIIRRSLNGVQFAAVGEAFEILGSRPHGHVQAVSAAMQRLGMASIVASAAVPERDLVLAMIAARIVQPDTKLATTRSWHDSTLAEEFGVAQATERDLYAAMDWLLERQGHIERKLARRHLTEGGLVMYDLSSSYFEGETCPLAKRGHSRDGKPGTLQVNYGVLTDARGCPVAVSVFEGNTADSTTFLPALERVRGEFGIERAVMVGDRGMISKGSIAHMRTLDGVDWITALKSSSIRTLVETALLQPDLFDERNLFEIDSPEYPGERLIACRNEALLVRRAHKRESLLAATEAKLTRIAERVAAGRLAGREKIGVAVGKVVDRHKVAKHFDLTISDTGFTFGRNAAGIASEAALDGIYVIRTSVDEQRMDAAECVRRYKALAEVEKAFGSMKSIDLQVRPIHHRLEHRVRAHIFLCLLAQYVVWHMRQAWSALTFMDTEQHLKADRDPVAPAARSEQATKKAKTKKLENGSTVHSFQTLLASLSSIVRNTCRTPTAGQDAHTFDLHTTPSPAQARAFELLRTISP